MADAVKQTARIGEGKAGPGRPKGVPNKTTQLLKDALIQAATDAGQGDLVAFLRAQAEKENNTAFLGLLGRVIPLQVDGNIDSTVTFKTVYEDKRGA